MGAAAIEAAALLFELRGRGYKLEVCPSIDQDPEKPAAPVLSVEGPQELDDALRERIREHKLQLKLLVLFENPPTWLRRLAERCLDETLCEVRRTNPTAGKPEPYVVYIRDKQVAAAVASTVGAGSYHDVLEETRDFLDAFALERGKAAC